MKIEKSDSQFIRRWSNKIRAVNLMGGRCIKCGNSNVFHLQFHHEKDKDKNVSRLLEGGWPKIAEEIKKCILVCGNCHQELHCRNMGRWSDYKKRVVRANGDARCSECGYVGGNMASLEFHHTGDKKFQISGQYIKFEDVINEINNCDLICTNCHVEFTVNKNKFKKFKDKIYEKVVNFKTNRFIENEILELHGGGLANYEIAKKLDCAKSTITTVLNRNGLSCNKKPKIVRKRICKKCKLEFDARYDSAIYCSAKCKHSADRKLNISKLELEKLLKFFSYSSIARIHSVVPNTVKNLAKRYELI